MPSIELPLGRAAGALPAGGEVTGFDVISIIRCSSTPIGFPPDMVTSSVIQMSSLGRCALRSSRISGQKLRSLTAVMSGVATLSREAVSFRSLPNFASAAFILSTFAWTRSVLCRVSCAARV